MPRLRLAEGRTETQIYSPAWNPECYKWSTEYWVADSRCTHNLRVRNGKRKGFRDDVHTHQSFHDVKQPDSAIRYFDFFCVCRCLRWKDIFPPRVKFNWNASNRIKDFWSATRLPFQSKHYAQGELCYCSTPFIHQWAKLTLTSSHPTPHQPGVVTALL